MDEPSQGIIEIETNWVIIDPIDFAEEATEMDMGTELQKKPDLVESDLESDGISVISESSHIQSTTDDEHFHDSENSDGMSEKKESQAPGENMSDSGSVTWTFVNSAVPRPESPASDNSSKQFYLNCLQEPVQELSEHELGSMQSDQESDSISIISECESLDENNLVPLELRQESMENMKLQIVSKNPPSTGIHKYFNGLMIGTILLASGSIFLGQYLNINDFIEEANYAEDFINNMKANEKGVANKYNVPTALSFCKSKHEADAINMQYNVNKCLKKIEKRLQRKRDALQKSEQVHKMEKHLKIKEQYLGEKEKFLIKKEYELLKVEMKLKKQHLKKYQKTGVAQKRCEYNVKPDPEAKFADIDSSLNFKGENEISQKQSHSAKDPSIKETHKNNKKYHESYDKKAELSNTKYQHEKIAKKNANNFKADKSKFKKEKDKTSKKEKCTVKSQSKNSQEKNYDTGTNYVILENSGNKTTSGYWLGKLYKARSDLRNKEHLGDWYFDRASYRKRKRDKASWYFDWMMDREVLRYKRTYYI